MKVKEVCVAVYNRAFFSVIFKGYSGEPHARTMAKISTSLSDHERTVRPQRGGKERARRNKSKSLMGSADRSAAQIIQLRQCSHLSPP